MKQTMKGNTSTKGEIGRGRRRRKEKNERGAPWTEKGKKKEERKKEERGPLKKNQKEKIKKRGAKAMPSSLYATWSLMAESMPIIIVGELLQLQQD